MKLSDQYNKLIDLVQDRVIELLNQVGKSVEDLHHDKFIDMREHNINVDGYQVAYLNSEIFMDSDGMHYQFFMLEL
jgi:hypothetical protein